MLKYIYHSKINLICLFFISFFITSLTIAQKYDDGQYFTGMHMMDWRGNATLTTVSGKIIVDSSGVMKVNNVSLMHKVYYLDTLNNGTKNLRLYFGPYWYSPKNGLKRPSNGQSVTLKGIKNNMMNPAMFAVYEINGQQWRPANGAPPWAGGMMLRSSADTTRIFCLTDSLSNFKMSPNSMGNGMMGNGMMWKDSVFVEMFEMMTDSLPNMTRGSASMGFHVDTFDMQGSSMMKNGSNQHGMMSFTKNIKMRFHVNSDSLMHKGMTMNGVLLKYLDTDNQWKTVQNPTIDASSGIISTSISGMYSYYAVVSSSATSVQDNPSIPLGFELKQNYPNPFNPSTKITYSIPQGSPVTIKIYDVIGKLVAVLVNETQEAGIHSVSFNASNLASGIYFYEIRANSFLATRKMILLK